MESSSFENILKLCGGFGRYQCYVLIWHLFFIFYTSSQILFMLFAGLQPTEICIFNATNQSECYIQFRNFYATVEEWKLYGERKIYSASVISFQVIGTLFGAIIGGQLSDRFGRKNTYIFGLIISLLISAATAFSFRWEVFATFRFLYGIFSAIAILPALILYIEIVLPRWRLLVYVGGWPLGYIYLCVLALLTKHWRYLCWAITGTGIISLLMTPWIYETPKWLVESGRIDAAKAIFHKIAHRNKVKFLGNTFNHCFKKLVIEIRKEVESRNRNHFYYWHLFYNRKASLNIIVVTFTWFTCSAIYYGMIFNLGNLSDDVALHTIYIMLFRMALNGILVAMDQKFKWFGRKIMHQLGNVGVILCITYIVIAYQSDLGYRYPHSLSISAIVGIGFTSPIWIVADIYPMEMVPTLLRSQGFALCMIMAIVASSVSPQLILLQDYWKSLPYIIFLILVTTNSLLVFLLPETKGKPLPELPLNTGAAADDDDVDNNAINCKEKSEINESLLL